MHSKQIMMMTITLIKRMPVAMKTEMTMMTERRRMLRRGLDPRGQHRE